MKRYLLTILFGLLLGFNVEAMTVTANGTSQVDTAQSKFGGAALLTTNVTTDFLSVPDDAEFAFGAGDFTLEVFYRSTDATVTEGFMGQRGGGARPDRRDASAGMGLRIGDDRIEAEPRLLA